MTLDGHEDWVRWGRNRVGLRGDMQLEVGGGIRKKINMMRICWCFFGDWKVFASAVFFLMVGKTRSWIALPFGKRHPKLTCVYVCRWLHILMIWYLYTRTIFDVYIYIYICSCTCQQKRIHLIYHLHKNCWTCATQDRQLLAWWWGNLVQLISDFDSEIWWGNHLLDT